MKAPEGCGRLFGRAGPGRMTLADLCMLVIGCAVALTWIRWLWGGVSVWPPWPTRAPSWYKAAILGRGLSSSAGIALLFPVFARRLRYGSIGGPGELTVFSPVAAVVASLFLRLPVVEHAFRVIPHPSLDSAKIVVRTPEYWIWLGGWLVAATATLAAFVIGCRRLPGWASTALLGISVIAFQVGCPELIREGVRELTFSLGFPGISDICENGCSMFASLLIPTVILAAGQASWQTRSRNLTWLEVGGMLTALVFTGCSMITLYVAAFRFTVPDGRMFPALFVAYLLPMMLLVTSAPLLVMSLARAWNRIIGVGYD